MKKQIAERKIVGSGIYEILGLGCYNNDNESELSRLAESDARKQLSQVKENFLKEKNIAADTVNLEAKLEILQQRSAHNSVYVTTATCADCQDRAIYDNVYAQAIHARVTVTAYAKEKRK